MKLSLFEGALTSGHRGENGCFGLCDSEEFANRFRQACSQGVDFRLFHPIERMMGGLVPEFLDLGKKCKSVGRNLDVFPAPGQSGQGSKGRPPVLCVKDLLLVSCGAKCPDNQAFGDPAAQDRTGVKPLISVAAVDLLGEELEHGILELILVKKYGVQQRLGQRGGLSFGTILKLNAF